MTDPDSTEGVGHGMHAEWEQQAAMAQHGSADNAGGAMMVAAASPPAQRAVLAIVLIRFDCQIG